MFYYVVHISERCHSRLLLLPSQELCCGCHIFCFYLCYNHVWLCSCSCFNSQWYFNEIWIVRKHIVSYPYPHSYNCWCPSFLCVIYISIRHDFLLPESAADELFVYLKKSSFLKIFLLGIEIYVDNFLLHYFKDALPLSSWMHYFQWKSFKNFPFHWFCEWFYHDMPWCGFLRVSFAWGSLRFFNLWVYSFLFIWRSFISSKILSIPFLLDTSVIWILGRLMWSHTLLTLCLLFCLFCFALSHFIPSIYYFFLCFQVYQCFLL